MPKCAFPTDRSRLCGRFDDRAAHIEAALRANRVRGDRIAALRAVGQLLGLDRVMGTAAASAGIRLTSLGNGHAKVSIDLGGMAIMIHCRRCRARTLWASERSKANHLI